MIEDINRIEHMIDACEKIIRFTNVEYAVYESSEEKQAAVTRYLEVLGEAANKVSSGLRDNYPDIPWRKATSLRNILIHDYVKVDYEEVWNIAKMNIPPMLADLKIMLEELGGENSQDSKD